MPGIDKDELEKAAEIVFDRLNYFNDYVHNMAAEAFNLIDK